VCACFGFGYLAARDFNKSYSNFTPALWWGIIARRGSDRLSTALAESLHHRKNCLQLTTKTAFDNSTLLDSTG